MLTIICKEFFKRARNVGETITLKTSSGSSVNLKVDRVKSSGDNMLRA